MENRSDVPRPAAAPPKRVSLFITCLVDQVYPEVGESVVNVLERLGVEVDVPPDQTCCGQPAFNSGYRSEARDVAARFVRVFQGDGPIVTPSGSCAAMVRNFYPELFHDYPALQKLALKLKPRLFEFSEFLVDVLGPPPFKASRPGTAVYHQSCHLLRELGVDAQPKALLAAIEGLELRDLKQAEVCCGFGGTFATKMPDVSTAMLDEKLDNVLASGAETLIAADSGCIMQMAGGLSRRGARVRTAHLAQVLDEGMRGAG